MAESGVRDCTPDDFKRTDMLKSKYEEVVNSFGDIFFCPQKNDFVLIGGPQSKSHATVSVTVKKCTA